MRDKDWTRERTLSFEKVGILILRGHKLPLQGALNRVYRELGTLG